MKNILFTLTLLISMTTFSQDLPRWHNADPEDIKAGNYKIGDITYSKDGDTRFEIIKIDKEQGKIYWSTLKAPIKYSMSTVTNIESSLGGPSFGLNIGFGSSKAKVSDGNTSISTDSYSGVSTSLIVNIPLSSNLHLETGLGFSFLKVEGESSNSWGIPLTAKYYTNNETGFHLRGGLGYGASLEDIDTSIYKKDALSAGFGIGYDINLNFSIAAEYSTQLSNSISNSAGPEYEGLTLKGSGFGVSLYYFF